MGQRLVLTVKKDSKRIANIYYHWSGYSVSSLMETKKVIEYLVDKGDFNPKKRVEDIQLDLIRFVEGNGGCIDGAPNSKEFNAIQEMFKDKTFSTTGSRNEGLIALTKEGMDDMQSWSEGDVILDITNGTIENYVIWCTDLEECLEDRELTEKDLLHTDFNMEEFNIDDIDYCISFLSKVEENNGAFIYDGMAYELIY